MSLPSILNSTSLFTRGTIHTPTWTPLRNYMLGTLKPSQGSTKTYKRLGRGPSSGKGKTSGRGQKGQKARSKVKPWFEGGQTPIYKLFPKVGFTNVHARPVNWLNLEKIQEFHENGRLVMKDDEILDMKKMMKCGLVTGSPLFGIKVLSRGKKDYNLPFKIEATRASKMAIEKIEESGGKFTARYYSPLGLRAHLKPELFLRKYGRVPLQARPIKRKDVEFYSDEKKRGYLVMENDPFLKTLQEIREKGDSHLKKKKTKKGALELQLDQMKLQEDHIPISLNSRSKIVNIKDFK